MGSQNTCTTTPINILRAFVPVLNPTSDSVQGSDGLDMAKHKEKQRHSGEKVDNLPRVGVGRLSGSSSQASFHLLQNMNYCPRSF